MAGKDRGFYYMPEVDDEVLVAFEHGDFDASRTSSASCTTASTTRPTTTSTSTSAASRPSSGHILEFDDRAGKERIELKTQGGHHLEMEDSPGTVKLETSGGQKLVMEDTPGKITLDDRSGTKLELNDLPSSVQVSTTTGVDRRRSPASGGDLGDRSDDARQSPA